MIVVQQGRSRKDSLVPIRRAEMDSDLKIEIVDMSMLNGVEVVTMDTDQMFEVISAGSNSPVGSSSCMSPSSVSNDRSVSPAPSENPRPRKRAKLDHLSSEEKAQHRKMMNRISAQSARDRQKAYMNQQEGQIKELAQQVEGLKTENKKLKSNSEKLAEENASLREMLDKLQNQLKNTAKVSSDPVAVTVKVEPASEQQVGESCTSFEPAALNAIPLQKGSQVQLTLAFLSLMWGLYQSTWTQQKSLKPLKPFLEQFLSKKDSPLLLTAPPSTLATEKMTRLLYQNFAAMKADVPG